MTIQMNVPNIGNISVDGAAEEATLQQVLVALHALNPNKTGNPANDVNNALKGLNTTAQKSNSALTDFVINTQKGGNGARLVSDVFNQLGTATLDVAKSFDTFAKSPIDMGSKLINVGIGLAEGAAKTTASMVGAAASIGSAVPLVGGAFSSAGKAIEIAGTKAAETLATIARTANDLMAAEFKKRVESVNQLSSAGASFAGGMSEMSTIAHNSGLGVADFSTVIKSSRETIASLGLTATEASGILSKGMSALNVTQGKSGNMLREEMLAMGFSYEKQGEVMAQYMLQQKASGNLSKMTTEEIAKGTKEYATNLKVISDITGKDAAALMEKARAESSRAALLNSLSGEEKERFKQGHALMEKLGPEMQAALVQQLANGQITDPTIAANQDAANIIRQMAAEIKNGTGDMKVATAGIVETNVAHMRNNQMLAAADRSAIADGSGLAASMSKVGNHILAYGDMSKDGAESSKTAAQLQSESTDAITKGFQEASKSTNKFQVEMERLADKHLPMYAGMIETTITTTTNLIEAAVLASEGKIKEAAIKMGLLKEEPEQVSVASTMFGDDKEATKIKLEQQQWDREQALYKKRKELYDVKTQKISVYSDEEYERLHGKRPGEPTVSVAQPKESVQTPNQKAISESRAKQAQSLAKVEKEATELGTPLDSVDRQSASGTVTQGAKSFAVDAAKDYDMVVRVLKEIRDLTGDMRGYLDKIERKIEN